MKLNPWLLYNKLEEYFGYQNWWPIDEKYHSINKSDYRFEIIIGAILTQNTTWLNVEKALINLKLKKILDIDNLVKIHKDELKK